MLRNGGSWSSRDTDREVSMEVGTSCFYKRRILCPILLGLTTLRRTCICLDVYIAGVSCFREEIVPFPFCH